MNAELIPHLFRTEYSKITAVLCKHFGLEQIETAEDIASETFLSALNTWPYKGIPENPTGWLYTVAKNKTRNYLLRRQTLSAKIEDLSLGHATVMDETVIDLSAQNISDSQLRMLFGVCHPSIPVESQIGLALRILCGFGIDEIATAFLTTKDTINKRLFRAKERLRAEKITLEFPSEDQILPRLDSILTTLYLLYNEGYYSESNESIIREDLCFESMRLTSLLLDNVRTSVPEAYALLSLMCFHSSRLKARRNQSGTLVLYDEQDESLWDFELISKGVTLLQKSSGGRRLSKYHIEAQIAYWHTTKAAEKWEKILELYNYLLVLQYSPIAALNRTYALSKVKGNRVALEEAEKLKLTNNHFYFHLLAELSRDIDPEGSRRHYLKAIELARTRTEKSFLEERMKWLSISRGH